MFKNSKIKELAKTCSNHDEFVSKIMAKKLAQNEGEARKLARKFRITTVTKKEQT